MSKETNPADLAQRVARLERLCDTYRDAWSGYHPLADYMQQLSDADKLPVGVLGRHYGDIAVDRMRSQEARIADMGVQRNTTAAHVVMIARQLGDEALQVDDIAVRVLALVAERDAAQHARRAAQELAERYQAERNAAGVRAQREVAEQVRALTAERDELLVALHGIGRALGLAEGARSPYSITCGVLERANRLAEIEAQGPVAISKAGNLFWSGNPQDWRGVDCNLYAGPIPAQAVPDGWRLVPVNLTQEMRHAWDEAPANSDDDDVNMNVAYGAMIAAAPEHKA